MYRRTDYEYSLTYQISSMVAQGYHVSNRVCPESRRKDLNRDLGLNIKPGKATCFQVFKRLYLMWVQSGLNETRPNSHWLWEVYRAYTA